MWTGQTAAAEHLNAFLPSKLLAGIVPASPGRGAIHAIRKIMSVKKKATTGSGPIPNPKQSLTNNPVRISSLSPELGRFECYWQSRKESNCAWPEKEDDCRKACAMDEVTLKWREDGLVELSKLLEKIASKAKSGQSVEPEEDPALIEVKRQLIQDDCNAWRIGQEIRLRRIWIEVAEEWALETVRKRRSRMEVTGLNMADFLLPGSMGDTDTLRHAKGWLPVYYEYVRQSPRWLQWARMRHTQGGDPMRDCESDRFAELHLLRTLGRGWIDALSSLASFLGEDVVFSEIPMDQRIAAAQLASFSCGENIAVHPESWGVIDGGRPTCPPEAKWAGKQPLRVAKRAEAIAVGTEMAFDSLTLTLEPCESRNALRATVEESFIKVRHRSKIDEENELEWDSRNDLSERNVDDSGAEIIVLRVNWNHTSNKEIGDAMKGLCEEIRPERWPEFKEVAGDKDQSAEKALKLLLYWRLKTASGKDSAVGSLRESKLKREMGKQLEALGVKKSHAMAAKWFKDITGDDAPAWWSKSVTN